MGKDTNISWAAHTFNPWIGCTKVSDGCKHCYAERDWDHRHKRVKWGPTGDRSKTSDDNWREPLRWQRDIEQNDPGGRRTVFCASLADIHDDHPSILPEWRAMLWGLVCQTPNLDWVFLTKRPENWRNVWEQAFGYLFDCGNRDYAGKLWDWIKHGITPKNVWMGVSVEDQAAADMRIPELLKIPALVRFLSCEPLLGPVNLRSVSLAGLPNRLPIETMDALGGTVYNGMRKPGPAPVTWVICGGESGPNARPMHPDWVRSLRDQCQSARHIGVPVAFHFKQWGEYCPGELRISNRPSGFVAKQFDACVVADRKGTIEPFVKDGLVNQSAAGEILWRVGKKAAGRKLDGREWNEFPIRGWMMP